MRKWMRERLQRKKKTPVEPSDQPAPPPLQPAYFDAEQTPSPAPDAGKIESEISSPPPPEREVRPARRARSIPQEQPSEERSPAERSREERPSGDQPFGEQPTTQQAAPTGSGSTGRGRRRRGGRGRGGRGREQAVAQAFAPAAVKSSVV